jgi:hypothetical protein
MLVMLEVLEFTGKALIRIARRRAEHRPQRGRGATVRPGLDTPLWLALVARVRPHLRAYGAKARLARELDLDPSRISQFFVTRTAQPDAERALLLLGWLARQKLPLLNKQGLAEAALTVPAGRGRRRSA